MRTSMRSVVIDASGYDWEGDKPLNRPMEECIIYEAHVRGFTQSPTSGVQHPGTFAGLVEKIPYLKDLGITAVELLPVFDFDENGGAQSRRWEARPQLLGIQHDRLLRAPVLVLPRSRIAAATCASSAIWSRLCTRRVLKSFSMWSSTTRTRATTRDRRILFKASITAPTICSCLGRCNTTWIFPGAGTPSIATTRIAQKLIVECLRYWVREAHVDGFRFDEGSILSRGEDGMPAIHPPLVWHIELDEDLADTKLIAEAWDAAGLYQIGHFPGDRWAEWNGRYRDDVRRFVRGDPALVGAIASRLGGSADIYQERGGSPLNSVNFVTCHDGFTLGDLVSFNQKHNEANGEYNR